MTSSPEPGTGESAVQHGVIPPPVAAAAQHHRLGTYLASQRMSGPAGTLVGSVAAGVGLLVLGFALLGAARALGTDHGSFWLVRILAGASCISSVPVLVGVVRGAAAAGRGASSSYLFDGGVIHFADGRVEVIGWPEIEAVHRVLSPEGPGSARLTRLRFVRRRGLPTSIPVEGHSATSPFANRLLGVARAHGVTIAETH